MPAALVTLFATTVTLAVPAGNATDCPSAAQLTETLNTHVPGLVSSTPTTATPAAPPPGPGSTALRLAVTTLSGGDVRFELLDAEGEALLHRVLPAPPRGHDPDCPALAETVALVVERYLHDVGYEAPPLAPPPPRAAPPPPLVSPAAPPTLTASPPAPVPRAGVVVRLGVAAHGRLGDAGGLDGDGDLAVSIEGAGPGRGLGARLSVGLAPPSDARWSDTPLPPATTSATLERVPLRLGAYLRLPLSEGQLEPGVGAGAELLIVDATGPGIASEHHVAPFFDLALGYTVSLSGPVYLRGLSRAALEVPYDFNTFRNERVWGTARIFGEVGVELGFAFR